MLEFSTGIETEMKIASLQLNNAGLQPTSIQPTSTTMHQQNFNQKRCSKKEAKLLQQKMEHLARINIHLQGKNNNY